MNKALILILAVCLVSVHAFVKRDAPESAPKPGNFLEESQKKVEEIMAGIGKLIDPEAAKENVNKLVEGVKKALDDLKPKDQPKA